MKGCANLHDVFRFHARIGGVHLAGLAGCEVDERMGDDGNEDEEKKTPQNLSSYIRPHMLLICLTERGQYPSRLPLEIRRELQLPPFIEVVVDVPALGRIDLPVCLGAIRRALNENDLLIQGASAQGRV